MTDLTEQFLDDEIDESKLYYFKQKISEEIEVGSPFALNMVRAIDGIYLDYFLIDKVLSPVPSYEEWQAKLEENAQLKELLKRCYAYMLCEFGGQVDQRHLLMKEIGEVLK